MKINKRDITIEKTEHSIRIVLNGYVIAVIHTKSSFVNTVAIPSSIILFASGLKNETNSIEKVKVLGQTVDNITGQTVDNITSVNLSD